MTDTADFEPLVSVVVPVYNGADYVSIAIDSIQAQTYRNFEIIVVNDGSTDDGATDEVLRSYGDTINYQSKSNGGVASALNRAIAVMQGDYLSWLSHDDRYLPEKLERQIDFLRGRANRNVAVYSDYFFIDDNGNRTGEERIAAPSPEYFQQYITQANNLNGCTLLVPRVCFEQVGVFDESLRTTQDYALWFDFADHFDFIHLPERLIESRLHEAQGTRTMPETVYRECNELLSGFLERVLASGRHEISAFRFCLDSADSFRQRGFNDSYAHAKARAREYLKQESGLAYVRDLYAYLRLKPVRA